MKRAIIMLLVLLLVLPMAAQCGGVLGGGGVSISSGSGGGSSRQTSLDSLLKTLQDAKNKDDPKFEELRTLLWKNPITREDYVLPTVLMYYEANNTTVSRNQPLEIATVITNNNPPEMRRMLDLFLEVKNPGSNKYVRVNPWPNKIQANEYSDKTNTTYRIWGDLPSFGYLKTVGDVRVRANVSDGVNRWSTADYRDIKPPFYSELVFNVTNIPPVMSNFTVTPSGRARYNDPIEYRANTEDPDGDMLNVTLHILDQQGKTELRNATQEIKGGEPVRFRANEYGFFTEADAGKNFTYYYSFDDGIATRRTDIQKGPTIRRGPKLFVDKLAFSAESENFYWWQWYTFSARVKNLNPEEFDVVFTLYTDTIGNPGMAVGSKTLRVGPQSQMICFNQTKPFVVTDANESFSYRIKFSELDQGGRNFVEGNGPRINPKIVPYAIYNPVMVFNLALMFILIIGAGLFMERKLKRGIESQESSSAKSGSKKKKGRAKGGSRIGGIASKVSALFRRGG